ncbi:MAG: leucine-rich repeat domain-containing protein, partial [Bacteroidaceae bacterium]|nr:leucine-rich repeat domain-containing protein [Bacteroidaceae bacterium]
MKKHLLLLFAGLLPMLVSAQTKVQIDGIWYNLISKAKQAEMTWGENYSGSITIPATVSYDGVEYSVTSIGESAFRFCSSLTSITIPEGVTSIELYAFDGCTSLTSITIPKSVTKIGEYAFNDCSSLASITIPEGVTSIGYKAFSGCTN